MYLKSLKLLLISLLICSTNVLYGGTPPNDASISSIEAPYDNHCSGPLPIKVILNNYGTQELDSVKIWWSVNDTIRNSYRWFGHLKQDSSTLVAIGSFPFLKGTYTIKVWTSKPNGQVDSVPDNDSSTLIAYIGPNAGGRDSICFGNSVTLGLNLLSGDNYTWTSNPPGFTSTNRRPIVTPKQTTTYYVTETNTTTNCVQRDTAILYLNPSHPVSAFTVNQSAQCFKSNAFTYSDKSVILDSKLDTDKTEGITSWAWDFGDKVTSKLQSPTHSYSKAGTYVVKLRVTGKYGCKDSTIKSILVNPTPAPVIAGPNSICLGLNVIYQSKFDSGSKYDWFITGGNIVSGNSTSKVTVYWIDSGIVSVNVTETTLQGCTNDAKQMNISVLRPKMAQSPNACIGQPYTFFDQSAVPVAFLWKFGDGDTSSTENPTHTYNALGKYTVSLKVTSSTGCQDSVSQRITVNQLPNAHWKMGSMITPNIVFRAVDSTLGVSDYEWDFGDGTNGGQTTWGFEPTHIFPQNKPYLVKLLISDNNGCVNTFDSTVNVKKSDIPLAPEKSLNLRIYPNPFHDASFIAYQVTKTATITISLYDISGKQVDIVDQETENPGSYEVEINDEKYNLTPGIYLLKFVMDGQYVSRRIVKY